MFDWVLNTPLKFLVVNLLSDVQEHFSHTANVKWDKVFKNGQSKTCGRQPLKKLKLYGLLKQTVSLQIF